jgi:hypothetical protein
MVHPRNVWEPGQIDVVTSVESTDPAVDKADVDDRAHAPNTLGTRHTFLHLGEPSEEQFAARSYGLREGLTELEANYNCKEETSF